MIVPVKYRFLRLNSDTLALVELYPNSDTPEVCQIQYLEPPYLIKGLLEIKRRTNNTREIKEWRDDCKFAFNLAVREAKFYSEINYYRTEKNWEKLLWGRLDPLVYWDEYVPLFDNNHNLILRD